MQKILNIQELKWQGFFSILNSKGITGNFSLYFKIHILNIFEWCMNPYIIFILMDYSEVNGTVYITCEVGKFILIVLKIVLKGILKYFDSIST